MNHITIIIKVLNSANRLRLYRIFLIGRNKAACDTLSVFKRSDCYIASSVKQHIHIGL